MMRSKIDEDNRWRTPTVVQIKKAIAKSLLLDEAPKIESTVSFELESEPSPPKKSRVEIFDSENS